MTKQIKKTIKKQMSRIELERERVRQRKEWGKRIKYKRNSLGMSQKELALEIGVSERTLISIEGGVKTNVDHYQKIQQELNIDDLFI